MVSDRGGMERINIVLISSDVPEAIMRRLHLVWPTVRRISCQFDVSMFCSGYTETIMIIMFWDQVLAGFTRQKRQPKVT